MQIKSCHALMMALLGVAAFPVLSRGETMVELPPVPREFRAVWVATVDNIDWPSKPGLSTEEQKAEMIGILDRCAAMNLNAVIFQVRPVADAFYKSDLEPWSAYLSGEQGKAPKPYYDPLEFVVEESHKRGMEVHAWFNPYRAQHPSNKTVDEGHVSQKHPDWVKSYGPYLWMDPGNNDALDHTVAVFRDVVKRYDVDGVHVDDYFYPYPVNDKAGKRVSFPDDESWASYTSGGGQLNRDDWRRDNINRMIEKVYAAVREEKPHVKVGYSPFGIWRPGHPEQIKGFDAYDGLYADAKLWLVEGWLDYLTPQIYWATDPPAQSFPVLLKWWVEQNEKGRHIWPGHSIGRSYVTDRGWSLGEIPRQIYLTRAQPGADGNVFFSMKTLVRNKKNLADMIAQVYEVPALVPESTWLVAESPAIPEVKNRGRSKGGVVTLKLKPGDDTEVSHWVIQSRHGLKWTLRIVPANERVIRIDCDLDGSDCDLIAVRAAGRTGKLSEPNLLWLSEKPEMQGEQETKPTP
ncbi:MAG: family 10 glycosylhydrolase [Phycisphaerae bacterium]|nr:family 10 glycosylhydrolase [Phycisphaerales bacterium]